MDNRMLHVSSSPHIRSKVTTQNIMLTVTLALLPAACVGILNFGFRALGILLLSIVTCIGAEFIYEYFMHLPITIKDGSALLTGLLLGLNLPASAPWYLPVIGGLFAIIIVKQLFGGLGQNIMNPAMAARCFLLISFAGRMTDFTYLGGFVKLIDTVSGATPMAAIKAGEDVDLLAMFIGNVPGVIGETSVIAILIGALILLFTKVISLRIPVALLGTFSILVLTYGVVTGRGFDLFLLAQELCGGGLMLGTWFMATDYVTSPFTQTGQIIYGCCIGFFTWLFRFVGNAPEGISYAIIFCNLLVPLIERITRPTAFGKGGKKA